MATRLQQLQNRKAAIVTEMAAMRDKLLAESRPAFSEEEDKSFSILTKEIEDVNAGLDIESKILAHQKSLEPVVDLNQNKVGEIWGKLDKQPVEDLYPQRVMGRNWNTRNLRALPGETLQELNKRLYTIGQFFLAAIYEKPRAIQWCKDAGIDMLAQSENVNTFGGILVPDVLSDAIIDLREQYGVFRRFAKVRPMGSDTLIIPRRLGGLTAYWVSDGVATTDSTKVWDGVTLVAKELASMVKYPITLAEDAIISVADDLTKEIAYAFALEEDTAGFTGDGSFTHGGIRGATVIIDDSNHGNSVTTNGTTNGGKQVAAAGGTSFGAMVLADFEKTVGLLPQYASANACWFFSRAGYASSAQRLLDAGGGNTNATLAMASVGNLTNQDPYGRPYSMFLGYPVIISQVLNTTLGTDASKIKCLFGDLSMSSSMGDRRGVTISTSKDRFFENRQIAIQGVERIDIVNHDLGTTTTAGPLVALESSAS